MDPSYSLLFPHIFCEEFELVLDLTAQRVGCVVKFGAIPCWLFQCLLSASDTGSCIVDPYFALSYD